MNIWELAELDKLEVDLNSRFVAQQIKLPFGSQYSPLAKLESITIFENGKYCGEIYCGHQYVRGVVQSCDNLVKYEMRQMDANRDSYDNEEKFFGELFHQKVSLEQAYELFDTFDRYYLSENEKLRRVLETLEGVRYEILTVEGLEILFNKDEYRAEEIAELAKSYMTAGTEWTIFTRPGGTVIDHYFINSTDNAEIEYELKALLLSKTKKIKDISKKYINASVEEYMDFNSINLEIQALNQLNYH